MSSSAIQSKISFYKYFNAFKKIQNIIQITDTLAAVNVAQESFIAVEFSGALLARMTPGFAYSGTAELFRTDHPLQLTLAHVVADAREARTRPVICAVESSQVNK